MCEWATTERIRSFIRRLESGETIVVDARDKTRTLEVTEEARHVRDRYQATGYYLSLEGYGTHYTLCVPDEDDHDPRLRYPSKPGLGERVRRLTRDSVDERSGEDSGIEQDGTGPQLVSDTTAADILDSGPEGNFR